MSCPIHGMAALLYPFYKTSTLFNERSLLNLKDEYINKMFGEDEQLEIDREMTSYESSLGPSFATSVALRPEVTKLPLTWWQSYGRQGLPKLTHLALLLLSQVKK